MEEQFITKEEIIKQIKGLPEDINVSFGEILDVDNIKNERLVSGNRDNLIKIIEENFDDNLHGHFNDEVWTTILSMGIWKLTETKV